MNYKPQICTNSALSCVEAQKGGAYRVELCAGIPEGGTTPSYGEIAVARELIDIKLNVIIRPRAGDFLYSDIEHKAMLKDIEMAKELGADGVVFGVLTKDGDVDMERNRELLDAAQGMDVTFHRAFDVCREPFEALEDIINLGFNRILTSGQQNKAEDGLPLLTELVKKAGDRIIIMPGSGVTEDNIAHIASVTKASEYHLSARKPVKSGMKFKNQNVSMGGTNITINEFEQNVTNAARVKATLKQLISS